LGGAEDEQEETEETERDGVRFGTRALNLEP
jgi:hypothetical protein